MPYSNFDKGYPDDTKGRPQKTPMRWNAPDNTTDYDKIGIGIRKAIINSEVAELVTSLMTYGADQCHFYVRYRKIPDAQVVIRLFRDRCTIQFFIYKKVDNQSKTAAARPVRFEYADPEFPDNLVEWVKNPKKDLRNLRRETD